ncbi:GNAT family N-acetyltransferase [soil metagenome]
MDIVLRKLTLKDEAAFLEGAKLWDAGSLFWYSFDWKPGVTFPEMLEKLEASATGRNLPAGRVPATMLYGFVGEVIVGRLHVRHELNEALTQRGGNIGYAVAPAFRGRRFATEMMSQGLDFCRSLGFKKVLVTCTEANVPSWKIIEHFGGVLENTVNDVEENELVRRYWIAL